MKKITTTILIALCLALISQDGQVQNQTIKSENPEFEWDETTNAEYFPGTITVKLKEGLGDYTRQDGKVMLAIYNLVGQVVRELVNEEKSAGQYSLEWDGLDKSGFRAPSGLYFYTLQVNGFRETRKMALTK